MLPKQPARLSFLVCGRFCITINFFDMVCPWIGVSPEGVNNVKRQKGATRCCIMAYIGGWTRYHNGICTSVTRFPPTGVQNGCDISEETTPGPLHPGEKKNVDQTDSTLLRLGEAGKYFYHRKCEATRDPHRPNKNRSKTFFF